MTKPLGIIAGNGTLPKRLAESHGSVLIAKILGADGDYSAYNHKEFAIGEIGGVMSYFRENKVSDVVMVGGIKRPNFLGLKVDAIGAKLLSRLIKAKLFGDDGLLWIVV